MNDEINYRNNPLHGVSLKNMLVQMEEHYGYKILFAYLNINCFKTNASIESSVKFLKKTDWAREKVEAFYMYQFKNFPRASAEQFELPPRDRIVPEDQFPGEPAELSFEDAERLSEKRARKAASRGRGCSTGKRPSGKAQDRNSNRTDNRDSVSDNRNSSIVASGAKKGVIDPWANSRK